MRRLTLAAIALALGAAPSALHAQTAPGTYEHAVECAAVTAVMLNNMRSEWDAAKVDAYDKANTAWIEKLGELAPDREPGDRMGDVIAAQRAYNDDPDAVAKAGPIAEACVAEVQPQP